MGLKLVHSSATLSGELFCHVLVSSLWYTPQYTGFYKRYVTQMPIQKVGKLDMRRGVCQSCNPPGSDHIRGEP